MLKIFKTKRSALFSLGLAAGAAITLGGQTVLAQMSGPKEHKGLKVDMLQELSEETLEATMGLTGYTMRMRAIEIAPGGQIAEHSHAERPGLVTVIDGEWVEGEPDGEETFAGENLGTLPEKEDTVHWFYNRTDAPATALVCDFAKTS